MAVITFESEREHVNDVGNSSLPSLATVAQRLVEKIPGLDLRKSFNEELEAQGAGVRNIAGTIADVMLNGENSSVRLKAASLAMDGLGLKEQKAANDTNVTFIFNEPVAMQNILQPKQEIQKEQVDG
jgi:hypothetical protein